MDEVAAQYHRLTKYDEQSVRSGPGLDFRTQPGQVKDIVSDHRFALRPYLPFPTDGPGGGERRPDPGDGFGIGPIGRLLFHANGPTGYIRYPQGGEQLLRAAPSAGALYPTEIYLACRELPGLPAGLYNYQVPGHELVRLWDADQVDLLREACGGAPDAPAWLVLTGLFWRSAWRYHERGYRRVLLDTGHVLGNALAYAPHEGLSATVHTGFVDSAVNGLFFFDEGVEAALACVALRDDMEPCRMEPAWRSPAAGDGDVSGKHPIRDEEELKESATAALHRTARCGEPAAVPAAAADPFAVTDRSQPVPGENIAVLSIPQAILRRRSARRYERAPLSRVTAGEVLRYALEVETPTRAAGLLRVHLAAHGIEGVEPGLYEVEGRGEALLPVMPGTMRDRVHRIGLHQDIGRNCAAVLVFSARARDALDALGDRAYRALHLDAGLAGERAQLAATALGAAGCGIGGFFDDEATQLVGLTPDDWVLYLVTLGIPA